MKNLLGLQTKILRREERWKERKRSLKDRLGPKLSRKRRSLSRELSEPKVAKKDSKDSGKSSHEPFSDIEDEDFSDLMAEHIVEHEKLKENKSTEVGKDHTSKREKPKEETTEKKTETMEEAKFCSKDSHEESKIEHRRKRSDKEGHRERERSEKQKVAKRLGPKPEWKQEKSRKEFDPLYEEEDESYSTKEFENLSVTLYRRGEGSLSPRRYSRERELYPREDRREQDRYDRYSNEDYSRGHLSPEYYRHSSPKRRYHSRDRSRSPRRHLRESYSRSLSRERILSRRSLTPEEHFSSHSSVQLKYPPSPSSMRFEIRNAEAIERMAASRDVDLYSDSLSRSEDLLMSGIERRLSRSPEMYPVSPSHISEDWNPKFRWSPKLSYKSSYHPQKSLDSESSLLESKSHQHLSKRDRSSSREKLEHRSSESNKHDYKKDYLKENESSSKEKKLTEKHLKSSKEKQVEHTEALFDGKRKELDVKRNQFCEKIETLYGELKRLQEQKEGGTDEALLKENAKLQKEVNRQVSLIKHLITKMNKILGRDEDDYPKPVKNEAKPPVKESKMTVKESKEPAKETKSSKEVKQSKPVKEEKEKSPEKTELKKDEAEEKTETAVEKEKLEIVYVCYDSSNHWCKPCGKFPQSVQEYLDHLKTPDHSEVMPTKIEFPWRREYFEKQERGKKGKIVKLPVQGLQWFVPVTGWYCRLCDEMIADYKMALLHLESTKHVEKYQEYITAYPDFEANWNIDRQKAYRKHKEDIEMMKIQVEKRKKEKAEAQLKERLEEQTKNELEEIRKQKERACEIIDLTENGKRSTSMDESRKSQKGGWKNIPDRSSSPEEDKIDEELFTNKPQKSYGFDLEAISRLKGKVREKQTREETVRNIEARSKIEERIKILKEDLAKKRPPPEPEPVPAPPIKKPATKLMTWKMPSFKVPNRLERSKEKTDGKSLRVEKVIEAETTKYAVGEKKDKKSKTEENEAKNISESAKPSFKGINFLDIPMPKESPSRLNETSRDLEKRKTSTVMRPMTEMEDEWSLLGLSPEDSAVLMNIRPPPNVKK